MLDQSFSAQNFGIIFNLLNRKGKVDVMKMSKEYQEILSDIKLTRSKVREIERRKMTMWTDEEKELHDAYKENIKEQEQRKNEILQNELQCYADEVNDGSFRFNMTKHLYGTHEVFTIDTSRLPAYYAICQLQHNMKKTFNVEMASRHMILRSIKRLLNMKMPIYIIRTDVSGFFEHIPQDKLINKVNDNTLLSYKSKAFIKGILNEYERLKDKSIVPAGVGVPRGVGISSMLSEVYMQDLDRALSSRKEVVYYVRYVDDIFMIMTSTGDSKDLNEYYSNLEALFDSYGLQLKPRTDGKCKLLDFVMNRNNCIPAFDYLGYSFNIKCGERNGLELQYGLSSKKKHDIKSRIDNAFIHFESLSKVNIKQARKDFIDSLRLISGNVRLKNSKSGVKTGLYYNNDLLDEVGLKTLNDITQYLHNKPINVHASSFVSTVEKDHFVDALRKRLLKIDLCNCWKSKRIYDFDIERIAQIKVWL